MASGLRGMRVTYESSVVESCASIAVTPERSESNDREIELSFESASNPSAMARCRSNSESLIWSARRKSCDGFGFAISFAPSESPQAHRYTGADAIGWPQE